MAHDGQDLSQIGDTSVLLDDLLTLTAEGVAASDALLQTAKVRVAGLVTDGGRVSGKLVEEHQTAAHGLAWLATYVEALRQMQVWAERL